jgi:dihydrofolate reductase
MTISLIVAVARNGIIGRDGDLPWHLPTDLKRFKALTMGHHLVVGRKTWEEVGRPLPGRVMVVVTRDPEYRPEGVIVVHSVEQALEVACGDDEVFIAGGGEVYRQALPLVDRMYVTRIHAEVAGDTTFPEVDPADWRLVETEDYEADERHEYPFSFEVYDRIAGRGARHRFR